jgi:hypothetical protein
LTPTGSREKKGAKVAFVGSQRLQLRSSEAEDKVHFFHIRLCPVVQGRCLVAERRDGGASSRVAGGGSSPGLKIGSAPSTVAPPAAGKPQGGEAGCGGRDGGCRSEESSPRSARITATERNTPTIVLDIEEAIASKCAGSSGSRSGERELGGPRIAMSIKGYPVAELPASARAATACS